MNQEIELKLSVFDRKTLWCNTAILIGDIADAFMMLHERPVRGVPIGELVELAGPNVFNSLRFAGVYTTQRHELDRAGRAMNCLAFIDPNMEIEITN